NMLRAQQEYSLNETQVEGARLLLYRAQEALGVLLVADGPVDAIDEPALLVPPDVAAFAAGSALPPTDLADWRPDLRLCAAQTRAAERVLNDSSKDRYPDLEAVFQPTTTYPSQFFLPQNSWRFLLQLSVPIYDSGQRTGQKMERQSALDSSRATFANALTTASSEVRAARESIASAERALASGRAAADQA